MMGPLELILLKNKLFISFYTTSLFYLALLGNTWSIYKFIEKISFVLIPNFKPQSYRDFELIYIALWNFHCNLIPHIK